MVTLKKQVSIEVLKKENQPNGSGRLRIPEEIIKSDDNKFNINSSAYVIMLGKEVIIVPKKDLAQLKLKDFDFIKLMSIDKYNKITIPSNIIKELCVKKGSYGIELHDNLFIKIIF